MPTRAFRVSAVLTLCASLARAQAPTLTKDFTIGCESCGGASQLGVIYEVALSPRGEVLIADRDAPSLRIFDASGKPVWSGGTKGRGPGEYEFVLRAAFTSSGLTVLDMMNSRVTTLNDAHAVASTTAVGTFITTAGANTAGMFVLAAEGPMGTLALKLWSAGALTPVTLPSLSKPSDGPIYKSSSVAISPTGVIAVFPNYEHYAIVRIDSAGKRLPDITRDIERVRRTPVEEAALRERIGRGMARVAEEANKSGKSLSRPAPSFATADLSIKPHVGTDGMRYDPTGRLWVHTLRGDDAHTIFDVFAPGGAFAGSVTIPGVVQVFALNGKWLVTSGESEDGIPQVTRWTVR